MSTTYGRPFDVKAAFGEVIGDSRYAYEQGGQLYNAHKMPVDASGAMMPLPPKKEAAPASAPVSMPAIDVDEDDNEEAPIEDALDLKAWAAGEVTATWGLLRAEVARQTGVTIASKDQAREAIAEFFAKPAA